MQGLQAGDVMDLTTGWDFRRHEDRAQALELLKKTKPKLVIGSPMCAVGGAPPSLPGRVSQTQAERGTEAQEHMAFVAEGYQHQAEQGKWFLHEHPAAASSWSLREIQKVMDRQGVKLGVP